MLVLMGCPRSRLTWSRDTAFNWDLRNIGTGLIMASRSIPSIPWGAHIAFDSLHRYIESPRYPENESAAGGVCLD